MSFDQRYSIEEMSERLWVIVDNARERKQVGGSVSESGARSVLALIKSLRGGDNTAERFR